jgi:Family of unknown function (DUF6527)
VKRLYALRHEFVEFIPAKLEHGVLYISIPYATTTHLCACGCGNEAVNPLAPHGWRLTFDGRTVSLSPSVGNWSFACESHYWIQNDQVDWAGAMSRDKINAGRARRRQEIDADSERPATPARQSESSGRRWFTRLRDLVGKFSNRG